MSERKGKLIGLALNVVYFIAAVVIMFSVNAKNPDMPGLDNMVFGAIGLLGALFLFIAYGMFGLSDYLTGAKRAARLFLIVVGIVILLVADLIALFGGMAIEGNGLDAYGPWYVALGGFWWIASAVMLLYFKGAQYTNGYQVGCMIAVPVSLAVGYALCGAVGYLPVPWLFALLLGLAILIIGLLIIGKRRDSSRSGRSSGSSSGSGARAASYSGGGASHSSERSAGSEGGLKRAVLDALPRSGGYLGSWGYGDIFLDSVSVDIWSSTHRVSVSGSVRFACKSSDGRSVETIRSNAQEHLDSIAEEIASRAVSAVEEYIDRYSGLDGDWSVSVKNISASFST